MELRREALDSAVGTALLGAFFDEIAMLYPGIMEADDPGPSATPEELSPPTGAFLVAYIDDEAVGCGGIKRIDDGTAELKRLYVSPSARNRGVARTVIAALEDAARAHRYRVIRLDTGDQQSAALKLFRSLGYQEIADYNRNPHASYWFEKRL
jgi:ribosomal protein S18 acetylase RimI-like enzyme